ncbi:DNA alkylation repair protein [Nocardioides sp.]|uniref:DNA alkylation repair protein n=1 Tax=Nocardioides sp. TaxID=35761 RepID=UPI003D0C0A60
MSAPDHQFIDDVTAALASAGDPERAVAQQRYMKSAMPYYGITSPRLKTLLRPILAAHPPSDRAAWEATVRTLWDDASHREERYAAIALARHRAARPWLDPDSLDLWRHLIVTGAWWDLVDEVATHLVREVLASHRGAVTPAVRAWASDSDLWLRRAAVICQVGLKDRTDLDLLRASIDANLDDTSFWLRKAIGWALRDQARTDPDWVRAEVDRLGERLSGLSRREALKHLS